MCELSDTGYGICVNGVEFAGFEYRLEWEEIARS